MLAFNICLSLSRYEFSPFLLEMQIVMCKITEKRSKLPIASLKDVITSTVESHQVVIICGETGCGKTTQGEKKSFGSKMENEKGIYEDNEKDNLSWLVGTQDGLWLENLSSIDTFK
ncbi:hypothetical protein Fmac_021193 [Flemingia macrophylla]|uniref:RNA helicase n=1 Tax=Flemingia macrophylla TaxID=520843 RepID=A0ABD1LW88_9FABA